MKVLPITNTNSQLETGNIGTGNISTLATFDKKTMKDFITRKTRSDAWGEDLSEALKWELYKLADYEAGCDRLAQLKLSGELDIEPPSRAGWYRFLTRRRAEENIGRIQGGVAEAENIAATSHISDATLVNALKALAADRVTSGDDKAGVAFVAAATALIDRMQKERDLELKAAAQETKDEQLKLAREKFAAAERRLNAVQGAVDAPQLTDAERVAKIKSIFGMK